jgi:hypothetical protein
MEEPFEEVKMQRNQSKLAVCAIVRNEELYIEEWVRFCRLVGVERFYIYLDYCTDHTEIILRKIDEGDIVVIPWTEDQCRRYYAPIDCEFGRTPQITSFNHWINNSAHESEWVAFIDPDEYMYHSSINDLRIILDLIPESGSGLWLQWLIFGRNGHVKRPEGLTIENYIRRGELGKPYPYGTQGKIIARSEALDYFGPKGSHNAVFKKGSVYTLEGYECPGSNNPSYRVVMPQVLCNHYYNRSEEEAIAKLQRGDRNAMGKHIPDWKRMELHNLNNVEDTAILRFLPALKKIDERRPSAAIVICLNVSN